MKLKILIILFFATAPIVAHDNYKKEVDSLIEASYNKYLKAQFIESLQLAEKSLELSTDKNYSKGKAYSYLYMARVLQEVGLRVEALKYIENVEGEKYAKDDPIIQADIHRIKSRITSDRYFYSLSKDHSLKQLKVSEKIADLRKKEHFITWAYSSIQHSYVKQNNLDSAMVYQDLLEEYIKNCQKTNPVRNLSALYADRGLIYIKKGEFDKAEEVLDKSIQVLESNNLSMFFYTLQVYGDLEIARGDTAKAISYYKSALENSIELNINHKSRDLHKKISDYLMHDELTREEAKKHLREYTILKDSLERHNKMLSDLILNRIINDADEASSKRGRIFAYIVLGLALLAVFLGLFMFSKNKLHKKNLMKKSKQLVSTSEKIETLEEELESNIYQDIIELAKSNSPEFLPLFNKGYPEFVKAIKQLNPTIRSSELYFCALAYLNFSTKDIANYTFVTNRAVQVRRNRLRKKFNIPSDADFNEWFRSVENGGIDNI